MDLTQLNDYTTRSEAVCRRNDTISPALYEEYGVKKGASGRKRQRRSRRTDEHFQDHVLQNLWTAKRVPCDGQLWYRGYRVEDLIGSLGETELGYERSPIFCSWGRCRTAPPRKNSGGCWASAGRSPPTSPGTSS